MPFQQLVRDITLREIPLRIDERDMVIDITNALQLIRMTMVMRTPIDSDQENRNVRP